MLELLKRYALGAVGLAVAAYALMQLRAAEDALVAERQRAEQREQELKELVQLLQRDSHHRVTVEVEQAKASGAEVRARPASVLEAKASEARGVAWDKQLDDALARGRRAGAR
jgi:hypothetical protein